MSGKVTDKLIIMVKIMMVITRYLIKKSINSIIVNAMQIY